MFKNWLADTGIEEREPPSFDLLYVNDTNPVSGNSKKRVLANPNPSMRAIHKRIIEIIDKNWFPLCGFLNATDPSPYGNASKHVCNRFFYQTDLTNAYQNVRLERLAQVIVSGCQKWKLDEVKETLERYCFNPGGRGLIVGANASPRLFNIYANAVIDGPLLRLWPYMRDTCTILRKEYTRYLDDLTFSSPEPIPTGMRRKIRTVIEEAGFKINHRKSFVRDIRKEPIIITGIGLAHNPHTRARLFLPRHYLSRIKGMLHLAIKGDPRISQSKIAGMMGVFYSVWGKKQSRHKVRYNATEVKVHELYCRYRSRLRYPTC